MAAHPLEGLKDKWASENTTRVEFRTNSASIACYGCFILQHSCNIGFIAGKSVENEVIFSRRRNSM